MGKPSTYVALATSLGVSAAAMRRARRRRAARGIQEALLPTHTMDLPTEQPPGADEAHAPVHRHLPPAIAGPGPRART